MKSKLIIILVFFISVSLYSAPERRLTWEPVTAAWGYNIEIRDSRNNIVIDTAVTETFFVVSHLEPGAYSFRVSTLNILKQKGESTPWIDFVIEKLYIPELKSVSNRQLLSSLSNKNIVVTGRNLKPGCRLLLRGNGKEIEITDITVDSDNEVTFSFKPDSSLKGKYDLVIINRGDAEAVLKDAFDIVEPEAAETICYAGAGYSVSIPFGIWSDYYAFSYTGVTAFFQFSGRNYGFDNNLFEVKLDAVRYSNVDSLKKSTLSYASLGTGSGYYYPVIVNSLEIFFKLMGGVVYTSVTLDENVTDKKVSSVDLYSMAGAGVRAYLSESVFADSACNWKTIFYAGEFLHEAGISLSCGISF
ncbi:MAG TPA: hypothetical protein PKG60_08710 [Spirochaetota bacterium]|nr:hypothetical protein [Spirochaetota bacterium]